MTWRDITLGECLTIKHGYAFKGEHFAESGRHVVLTPGNFYEEGGFRSRPGKDRYYAVEPPEDFILRAGDLVVAMTEQGEGLLGSSALVPREGSYLHNQRIGLIENLDQRKLHRQYLYHLFNTPSVRAQIRASATGGKVRHTAPNRIYAVKVRVPSVSKQVAIADRISAYVRLSENNTRRITLLVEAARLLYREWIVRFRFPGHEHVNAIEGLPEGWELRPLSACATFQSGGTPSKSNSEFWNGDIPWISSGELTSIRINSSKHQVTNRAVQSGSRYAEVGTILGVVRGMSLAKEFRLGIATRRVCFNQDLKAFVPDRGIESLFLFHALDAQRECIRQKAGEASHGTKKLETAVLDELPIIVAAPKIRRHFVEYVSPLYEQMDILIEQNDKIQQALAILLPRLINGQISV